MTEPEQPTTSSDASDSSTKPDFEGQDDSRVISDDQLPEDLQPTDDNPLAKPPSDDDAGISLGPDGPGAPGP